jgi:AraC-like DNA-binding protein
MNILDYIDQNYNKDLSLESIATEFGYSKYYLSRLFNDLINENLNNYVNIIRVQHASNMINESTDKTIAEIAYECGFSSQSYFSYVFKRKMKVTPREYVKEIYSRYEK